MELLFIYKNQVKFWSILILPAFLFASFSFAAFVIMLIALAIYKIIGALQSNISNELSLLLRDFFSYSNIAMAIIPGLILFFYYLGNIYAKKPISSRFSWQKYEGDLILAYFVFLFFMCGIYIICLWKNYWKDGLFLGAVAILILLPFTRMGLCNDIVMSGSIPSLFLLMILICDFLFNAADGQLRMGIIITFICIGAWYPLMELRDNINNNKKGMDLTTEYMTMERFANRELKDVSEDLQYNYYTYDLEGDIFYKYFAKHN